MDTGPKYVFLGLVVVVIGALAAITLHQRRNGPPEPPLNGSGSTFVYPLMVLWSSQYEMTESGCRLDYRPTGSGTGIRKFLENRIDFACSDAPLTDEQLAQLRSGGRAALHIPLVLGAVVPAYNLPMLKAPLRFTGTILASIYLGKITKWNDAALRELNPEAELPALDIVTTHRADSSGTTFIWTDYLAKVSPEWKQAVGTGTDVKWPVGVAAEGNEGVAAKVQKTLGCIGYMELTHAYRLDLAYGLVQNREKEFVKASLPAVSKAADNALTDIPEDLRYSLTDAGGKGSYPIAGTTWAIVQLRQPGTKGRQLVGFLSWAVEVGQESVQTLFYARLPESLVEQAKKKINEIQLDP